jgi:hypothetical protein
MRRRSQPQTIAGMLASGESSLLDLVDNVVNKGIVLDGDVLLGVADVDLVYLRLSAVLCAADRIFDPDRAAAPRSMGMTPEASRQKHGISRPRALVPGQGAPKHGAPKARQRKRAPAIVAPRRPPSVVGKGAPRGAAPRRPPQKKKPAT